MYDGLRLGKPSVDQPLKPYDLMSSEKRHLASLITLRLDQVKFQNRRILLPPGSRFKL
jgi:hypothetical protein